MYVGQVVRSCFSFMKLEITILKTKIVCESMKYLPISLAPRGVNLGANEIVN